MNGKYQTLNGFWIGERMGRIFLNGLGTTSGHAGFDIALVSSGSRRRALAVVSESGRGSRPGEGGQTYLPARAMRVKGVGATLDLNPE